jgi:hypothetical protein
MSRIIRVSKRDAPYAMIDKRFLSVKTLSFKAKGLLTYLLSKPDDWKVIHRELMKVSSDGDASVRSALKELEAAGYVHRRRITDSSTGLVLRWEIIVYETPELARNLSTDPDGDNPHVDGPIVDQPQVEKSVLLMNEVNETVVTKTDNYQRRRSGGGSHSALSVLEEGINLLVGSGFGRGDAERLAGKHTLTQIHTAVANAEAMANRGKLKSRPGYIRAALAGNYEPLAASSARPTARRRTNVLRNAAEINDEQVRH